MWLIMRGMPAPTEYPTNDDIIVVRHNIVGLLCCVRVAEIWRVKKHPNSIPNYKTQ